MGHIGLPASLGPLSTRFSEDRGRFVKAGGRNLDETGSAKHRVAGTQPIAASLRS
jgi:hypothetical protein